ncbi:MAG: hypothetical protein JOS17DRAFT_731863 [Linnemannia elongata]|nr:MAG: hypothetical protein JOS17DRAFT_731863 [Linnemannia elongata]
MTNREIQVTLFPPSSCCLCMWVYAYVCLHSLFAFVKAFLSVQHLLCDCIIFALSARPSFPLKGLLCNKLDTQDIHTTEQRQQKPTLLIP